MKKKILIVDDSEIDRNSLASVLKKRGFEVVVLDSGERCIEVVELQKPDAILLDIMMPNIHGKQLVHWLREKYTSISLPIIIVSARAEPEDLVECLGLGANDYVTKPVDFDIAIMRILTHLKIVELSRDLVRLKELEAIHAMITTYNHKINNPLSVALGALRVLKENPNDSAHGRLAESLWKIADIVKKIEDLKKPRELRYESYHGKVSKLVKLK